MATISDPYAPPRVSEAGATNPQYFVEVVPTWEQQFGGASDALIARITASLDAAASGLKELSAALYEDPELGLEEHRSVARVAGLLRAHGHDPQVGVHGLETSLSCEAGSGDGPTVAILAEYDALPGIGHACGHNMICAAGVGAFLAVADAVDQLPGKVVLLGTPAEENASGKETMARNGALDGIAAAMMVHPVNGVSRMRTTFLGLREVRAIWRGQTAHASATPYLGINALDAAVQAYTAVSMMRQQLQSSDRVHGIITNGGQAPNVIPDEASVHYVIRSETIAGLRELSRQLQAVFEAAAIATGCQLELHWDDWPPCYPFRANPTLDRQFACRITERGEEMFGELASDRSGTASSDMGNVSVRVPSLHPMLAIAPADVSLHTVEFADYACTERAHEAMLNGAFALAATAADLLADSRLLEAVTADFERAGGVVDLSGIGG